MNQFEFWWLGCCVSYFHFAGREQFKCFFFSFLLKRRSANWETSLCRDEDRSSVSGMWLFLVFFFCRKTSDYCQTMADYWRPIWSRVCHGRKKCKNILADGLWRTRFYANEPAEFAWPRGAIGIVLFGPDSLLVLPMSGACRLSLDEAIGVSLWPRKSVEPVRKSGTLLRNRQPAFW
jgi:hypothetical protein